LADEANRLVRSMAHARSYVFYTAGADGRSTPGVIQGRLDRPALAALSLPTDASAYVCGPSGFMDSMTTALADVGLAGSRIHTEVFASLSAINPGVVPADRPAPHVPTTIGAGPPITFARAGITAAFDEKFANLLELAEACDIPTRWSCRTGVCQTCVTPLVSGTVSYAIQPLAAVPTGQVLLCCTRPDTAVVLDL
jgi:ferredoxin